MKTEASIKALEWLEQQKDAVIAWENGEEVEVLTKKGYDNVLLGCTIEAQEYADRLDHLFGVPAKGYFLSIEPMLGPVNLTKLLHHKLSFQNLVGVVCGGETGPNARPVHPDWVRSLRNACRYEGIRFTFKSWGKWVPLDENFFPKKRDNELDGITYNEFPARFTMKDFQKWTDILDRAAIPRDSNGNLILKQQTKE